MSVNVDGLAEFDRWACYWKYMSTFWIVALQLSWVEFIETSVFCICLSTFRCLIQLPFGFSQCQWILVTFTICKMCADLWSGPLPRPTQKHGTGMLRTRQSCWPTQAAWKQVFQRLTLHRIAGNDLKCSAAMTNVFLLKCQLNHTFFSLLLSLIWMSCQC